MNLKQIIISLLSVGALLAVVSVQSAGRGEHDRGKHGGGGGDGGRHHGGGSKVHHATGSTRAQPHQGRSRQSSHTPSFSRLNQGSRSTPARRSSLPQQQVNRPIHDGARQNEPRRFHSRDQTREYGQKLKETFRNAQRPRSGKKAFSRNSWGDRDTSRHSRGEFRKNHPNHSEWFNDRFFDNHHYHPYYHNRGFDWWRGVGWGGVASWLSWGDITPLYYDYGGYPIERPLYVDVDNYYSQNFINQEVVSQGDWLPLGVFQAGSDITQATYSNLFIQLAINKQGDIAGTYYNANTNQPYELEGSVNQATQQAIWKLTDISDSPMMVTGLYNLTQDIVPVQIHFSDDTEQSWILVRLTENEQGVVKS